MTSKLAGTISSISTKTRIKVLKIIVALIVSNLFFFLLFSGEEKELVPEFHPGEVEVKLTASMLTPFQKGKRVILLARKKQIAVEAMLEVESPEDQKLTVWVKEDKARMLLEQENWEVLPFLKDFRVTKTRSIGVSHEIRY